MGGAVGGAVVGVVVTPAVRLCGVEVRYAGRPALAGVDLDVRPGERVALVGPSGAGKSTLLGLCTGAVRPCAGSVEVLGRSVPDCSERELRDLRRRLGSVHQQLRLVGRLRVVHNVNAGRLGQWGTLRALASLVRPLGQPEARAALAAVGLERHLHQRTERLSGGEQQRVALARVLLQRPDLVLADEPVSSLDPVRGEEVLGLLCDTVVAGGDSRALLASLHDFDLAVRRCDRVVGLREGRVAFDVPAAEVTERQRRDLYALARTP